MPKHTTDFAQLQFEFPEVKLCECGCGQSAPIATETRKDRGHIKGEPCRFIYGHAVRIRHGSAEKRFWKNIKKGDDASCWNWIGGSDNLGYGRIYVDGHTVLAHRYSWELHNGPIPENMKVLHKCDNPPCCNPSHLFLGTQADNMADMQAKGRKAILYRKGEDAGHVKLTERQVVEIRGRAQQGESQSALGREFGVDSTAIWRIVHRKVWKHI